MAELTYRQEGEYQIPDIEMPAERPIGKYGLMRKTYLKTHKRAACSSLILTGKLTDHLLEIDQTARRQVERIIKQMAQAQGITEELKANDQMRWVGLMNNIKHAAEESVIQDLINS